MSKNCTPLQPEAYFQVKMYKTHHFQTTFGRSVAEKLHAILAQSTCLKTVDLGPLLEDQMWKNGTPLWREAHFQVEINKSHHSPSTLEDQMPEAHVQINLLNNKGSDHFLDVESAHGVVARSAFPSRNVQNTLFSEHFGRSDAQSKCPSQHVQQ